MVKAAKPTTRLSEIRTTTNPCSRSFELTRPKHGSGQDHGEPPAWPRRRSWRRDRGVTLARVSRRSLRSQPFGVGPASRGRGGRFGENGPIGPCPVRALAGKRNRVPADLRAVASMHKLRATLLSAKGIPPKSLFSNAKSRTRSDLGSFQGRTIGCGTESIRGLTLSRTCRVLGDEALTRAPPLRLHPLQGQPGMGGKEAPNE